MGKILTGRHVGCLCILFTEMHLLDPQYDLTPNTIVHFNKAFMIGIQVAEHECPKRNCC